MEQSDNTKLVMGKKNPSKLENSLENMNIFCRMGIFKAVGGEYTMSAAAEMGLPY